MKHGRPATGLDNFFNLEKLLNKFAQDSGSGLISKDEKLANGGNSMKRQQTQPNIDNTNEYKPKEKKDPDIPNSNGILLTKSYST